MKKCESFPSAYCSTIIAGDQLILGSNILKEFIFVIDLE